MAQFVPGVIALYSVLFLYTAFNDSVPNAISTITEVTLATWTGSFAQQLALIGLCTGTGMLIRSLHWSVLRFLEHKDGPVYEAYGLDHPLYETYGHDYPFGVQVLIGPIKICLELIQLVFSARNIGDIAIQENVHKIKKDKMDAFRFIREFYLYFAQFCAHTSYSLVIAFVFFLSFVLISGYSVQRGVLLLFLYMGAGLFFAISRVQIDEMFKAENAEA